MEFNRTVIIQFILEMKKEEWRGKGIRKGEEKRGYGRRVEGNREEEIGEEKKRGKKRGEKEKWNG